MRLLRPLVSIAITASVLALMPANAAASRPVEMDRYSDSESGTFQECGLTIDFEAVFQGMFIVREVKGSAGQAFLGQDNYEFDVVLTNPDTGRWLTISGNGLFKEIRAEQIAGNIWAFTAMDVGQPFTLRDSDGNAVLRDRGRVTFRAVFDTLGDGQPGGELIEEEITSVSGPHPSLDADFCAVVTELIG